MSTPVGGGLLRMPETVALEKQVATLQENLAYLAWLHAEQGHRMMRLATTVAAMLTQQAQPQVLQAIMDQIMDGRGGP